MSRIAPPITETIRYWAKLAKWLVKHKKGEAPPRPPLDTPL